ncbi:MAG: MoxR family ATPase [Oscillospiraceae bacterium]|nr:MoxR family ATPase [Oscillospiraceae bacterium]
MVIFMQLISELREKIKTNIEKVIVGKSEITDLLIIALLCDGHVLIEDVPGTGKTVIVKSLAASVDCIFKRIQFTPDLLPTDITGINFFNMKISEFEFIPGPVFSNIILADEINRATPKTQSGLLECMEEHQVTIDAVTRKLSSPFLVIATQNPIESMGVFPLPEAQLDRFLVKVTMNYPTRKESDEILKRFASENPLNNLKAVVSKSEILEAREALKNIYVHNDLFSYISAITEASRNAEGVALGLSPRGALALLQVSKGYAAIQGRNYVIPDDIKRATPFVVGHRLILKSSAKVNRNAASAIVSDIISRVTVPTEDLSGWNITPKQPIKNI